MHKRLTAYLDHCYNGYRSFGILKERNRTYCETRKTGKYSESDISGFSVQAEYSKAA